MIFFNTFQNAHSQVPRDLQDPDKENAQPLRVELNIVKVSLLSHPMRNLKLIPMIPRGEATARPTGWFAHAYSLNRWHKPTAGTAPSACASQPRQSRANCQRHLAVHPGPRQEIRSCSNESAGGHLGGKSAFRHTGAKVQLLVCPVESCVATSSTSETNNFPEHLMS
jgi:hypothetical protein